MAGRNSQDYTRNETPSLGVQDKRDFVEIHVVCSRLELQAVGSQDFLTLACELHNAPDFDDFDDFPNRQKSVARPAPFTCCRSAISSGSVQRASCSQLERESHIRGKTIKRFRELENLDF